MHNGIQNYIDKSANKSSNDELFTLANGIELDTTKIFNSLNSILNVYCKSLKK